MYEGCPTILRADKGTENASLAKSHIIAFRLNHGDDLSGDKSLYMDPQQQTLLVKFLTILSTNYYDIVYTCHNNNIIIIIADRGIMVSASKANDIMVDRCTS